jgi:hypothetical protein
MRGGLGLAAALGLGNWRVMAQDVTPAATAPVTLVAHRLTNPRGFTWDSNGDLYVSLAGSGGAGVLGPDSGGGYATTGHSGIVARIENGNPVTVSVDLPSTTVSGERTLGPAAVAFLGDALYVLEDANAMDFLRNSPNPDGVYRINDDQSLTLIADTAAWISANPTSFKPADYNPGGEVFGISLICVQSRANFGKQFIARKWLLQPRSSVRELTLGDGRMVRVTRHIQHLQLRANLGKLRRDIRTAHTWHDHVGYQQIDFGDLRFRKLQRVDGVVHR